MSHAIGSFLGGVGRVGSNLFSGNFGGAANEIGKDIGGAGNWLGSVFSGASGKTGQPMEGLPGASEAKLAQSTKGLDNVGGGASPTTASAFARDMDFTGAGSSPLGVGLMSTAQPTPAPDSLAAGTNGGLPPLSDDFINSVLATPAGPVGSEAGKDVMPGAKPEAANGGFDLGHFLTRTALPGAAMAYQVYQGNQGFPGQGRLESMARDRLAQSQAMEQGAIEAMNGHLPGSAEAGIQQGLRAAQATIRSRYANMGLSGSTMEADDLASAEQSAVAMRFQIGQQMAQTGLAAAGNANSTAAALYELIMNGMIQQGTQLGNALAAFAGASAH